MSESYVITTEEYAGPLETLLDLIEARKMPVSKISLAEVCDGYLAYIEKLPELPLSETSQFVLVASTLLLIKSRSLLPSVALSDDEEQSIEELEKRLKHYSIIREASKHLRKTWGTKPLALARRSPSLIHIAGIPAITFSPREASVATILTAVKKLIVTLPKPERLVEATIAPILKLEDVIVNLKQRLEKAVRSRWSEITKGSSRGDMIVHFLAILELVRHGSLSVTQDKLFSDILLESDEISDLPRYG